MNNFLESVNANSISNNYIVRIGTWATTAQQEQWMLAQQAQNKIFVREWVL